MVRIRGVRCAISTDGHLLNGEGVLITNPKLLEFARKRRVDYRPESRVCAKCAKSLEQIYEYKLRRAIEKKTQRKSLTVSSSSSLDDFDRMVYRTPRTKHLRDIVKQNAPFQLRGPSQEIVDAEQKENQDNNISVEDVDFEPATTSMNVNDDSSIISVILEQTDTPPSPAAYEVFSMSRESSQNSSLDLGPSTSASATAAIEAKRKKGGDPQQIITKESTVWRKPLEPVKRKRVHFEQGLQDKPSTTQSALQSDVAANLATSTDDDDGDDFMPSINALNGTRLPHVQPIPKRRQFQHIIPTVQDAYMHGITGG